MPQVTFLLPDGSARPIDIQAGWSVMEGAREAGISSIVAECGGSAICGTCHVRVEPEWYARVGPAEGTEALLLEIVPERGDTSRLACQLLISEALDGLRVSVPSEQLGGQ